MKMHVCVDARLASCSGIGTLLCSTLQFLSQDPLIELTLLCRADDLPKLSAYSSRLIVMKSAVFSWQEQLEYVKKIPSCTLFWAFHFNIPILPIRAKIRITHICDVYHLAHFSQLSLCQKIYAKIFYNAAFLTSSRIVTISRFSKEEIVKYASIQPKKIEVIYPSFDFKPLQREAKGKFLLFVGNLKPHKNLCRLVLAYAKLRPKEPLYLAGKKEQLITQDTQLAQEVDRDPFLKHNVHFLGYVADDELKKLYAEALFLIFPSIYEGFGYPPLEAMKSGCPVVASKVASIPEVCQDAVEYIDPFSIDSIYEGMKRLLDDPARREELIEKGFKLIRAKGEEQNGLEGFIHACCHHP